MALGRPTGSICQKFLLMTAFSHRKFFLWGPTNNYQNHHRNERGSSCAAGQFSLVMWDFMLASCFGKSPVNFYWQATNKQNSSPSSKACNSVSGLHGHHYGIFLQCLFSLDTLQKAEQRHGSWENWGGRGGHKSSAFTQAIGSTFVKALGLLL